MEEQEREESKQGEVIKVDGMYKDWFLDYASYVILERAVPLIDDGMKPVQRRILHAMKEMDDGRFHKVANIIGQTMQYHPHGDAAIGDALVKLGQKNLLIDTQGNWGDVRTGDSAAAPRYIEARLTKFALDVLFNKETTEWQLSYDGRKNEPVALPAKFPLLLSQGVEGIAVGLSTKILPHNFNELIKASIDILKEKKVKIYPDFDTGGYIDVADYNGGERGGKVKVRAKIESADKKSLRITEIPFGTTTSSLIDSILKANDKGKIKIKKIIDNTAKNVEIDIELPPGVSPDVTIDALYAFTLCEQSISPNACVIINDKPHFLTVEEILRISTQNTKELLKRELEIKQAALNEKWHLSSLEKIFIENKIYRDIEEAETWEQVMEFIYAGLFKYVSTPSKPNKNAIALYRDITDEDVVKLTEIKIKRISKYDAFKADEYIKSLEEEQKEVAHHLAHLTEYAIAYFEELYKKYSKGQERKTEIRNFEDIAITQVAANNTKLYANYKEGFIGSGLKKDEFIADCSDIDDIIVFRRDGVMVVSRIEDKKFVGKDIIYVSVWKKNDERMTYHMIYADLKSGKNYVKRFPVTSITRDKEYQLTKSDKAKVIYFSAHPNSEEEKVQVSLSANSKARIKKFDYDFADLAIKGRNANGNVISKYPIRKVEQIGIGESTLGGIEIWIDTSVGRLNKDERGKLLGKFNTGNKILVIYTNGEYELTDFELTNRYEMKDIALIEKYNENKVISVVYFDGENKEHYVKRFQIETKTDNQKFGFISEHKKSVVEYVTTASGKTVYFKVLKGKNKERVEEQVSVDEFIDIKGWKAQGNKLSANTITGKIRELEEEEKPEVEEDISEEKTENKQEEQKDDKDKYKPGDTLEFDF
ncbi:MAG: DNA gyrase/topoisomerase IV subunit A [Bacteroidetes bacterium]|nr:DNA gyrase/topoisomerase IV subunit A [Bacteroidota bacterium]MCB9226613.1 DNA gyrase/topoisomerase IV subunit A [Chitinophagales bacterium]